MIKRVAWPQPYPRELPSPFIRGEHERAIKITLHTSSFENLSAEDSEATQLLRELAFLPEVDALETAVGPSPYIEIDLSLSDPGYIPVTAIYEKGKTTAGVSMAWALPGFGAASRPNTGEPQQAEARALFHELIIARAHRSLNRDILITSSARLHEWSTKPLLRDLNIFTPLEAAKVIGLFLRTRHIYIHSIERRNNGGTIYQEGTSRASFFNELVHLKISHLWYYLGICTLSESVRQDNTFLLAQGVLVRCIRALQARDAVGEQFYIPQRHDDQELTMYHFDYLTLLLSGALDAQARIAYRAYEINKWKKAKQKGLGTERRAAFHLADFQDALTENGAVRLKNVITDSRSGAVLDLLKIPRNMIHGASLFPLYRDRYHAWRSESLYLGAPEDAGKKLWDASQKHSSPEEWGLVQSKTGLIKLEPYMFVYKLTDECFQLINDIAQTTDVELLFNGHPVPNVTQGPPTDERGVQRRTRISLLG